MIRLYYLRKKKGLTQDDVAKQLGVSRQAYANYESGNREPNIALLKKLSEFYQVSIDYILDNQFMNLQPQTMEPECGSRIRIKEARKKINITARELADHIQVAESTVSLYENGKGEPNYSTLIKIANYLNVSIDYLLGNDKLQIINGEVRMPNRSKTINDSVGERIKQLRHSQNITQKELSEVLSKSESTVRMWELGKSEPDLETLKKLAHYFKVSIDYLLDDSIIQCQSTSMNHTMFACILKDLRKEYNLTQKQLAKKLDISKSAVSMYELAQRSPDYDMLLKIAEVFNVDINYLFGQLSAFNIPVLPIDAIAEELAASGEYVALKIKGDSMEPKMSQGDVVIVRAQPTIESGEIAIVIINGDNATCKKVKKTEEGIMLISLNSAYEPMFYSNKQIEELPIRIFGKVVELRAKF